jgi:glycosyltransferase involved in cell wall biosynthesis
MLRVLHLIYDDPGNPWVGGGGAVRVREIYRRLAPRLARVTVATGAYPGARDETIDGIHYRRLGAARPYAWSRLTYARAASRLLERGDYDAAVFDFSTYTLLRIPQGRPVGITVHHLTEQNALDRWGRVVGRVVAGAELKRLRQGRVFSATSRATHERLEALLGSDAVIRRVEAGVPDALFALPRDPQGYLLFFGRLDWNHKGLDLVLEAAARLIRERPGLRLRIAGRGKDGPRVADEVERLGIAGAVDLIGAVGDDRRDQLFSGAELMLMPSRFEGFGMAAAEAMAAGVPLVASDAGSLPEVVDPPAGGVVVRSGDAPALAAAAGALLDDPERRRRTSETARRSAERFRWDRIVDRHLEFLNVIRAAGRGASIGDS